MTSYRPVLSKYHQELLDIVFERAYPEKVEDDDKLNSEQINKTSLLLMYKLVKIEFKASLQKELESNEESSKPGSPNPYDVFIVLPTFTNKNIHIVVCVPIKGRKGEDPKLMWLDENDTLWELNEQETTRRVSSLSGTARVLENLRRKPTLLMQQAMDRTNVFDASVMECRGANAANMRLNDSQQKAVSAIDSPDFSSGFFVVQGPPGTGKTTTMLDMIEASNERVILSAPSNPATANIALKLVKSSRYHVSQLCVFGSNCDESVHFLNSTLRQEKFKRFRDKYTSLREETAMADELHKFASWLHVSQELSFEDIAAICGGNEERDLLLADVVFCTLNSAGSMYLRKNTGDRATFFLDEAGQCTEAEFYIATTFPGIKRVVVVGDPMQLPATVIDMDCKSAGFGRSWMSSIHRHHPRLVHLLDTQYRMDQKILEFPNKQFYNNRITSGHNVKCRSPEISCPVGFVDTSTRSKEERERFSWRNAEEASIVRALFRRDEDIQSLLQHQQETTVAVITPYSAQVEVLKNELRKVKNLRSWSVDTVDSFQGQEADIVVMSTVRTESIGFVDDPHRLNVALTRAKRVLRIVGCRKLFGRLRPSSTLRQLASFVSGRRLLINVAVKNHAFGFPDWREPSKWKATMNQRFHHCLKHMSLKEKAVSLRTLQAVATPNIRALYQRPGDGFWQVSSLRGHSNCSIVWIAKLDDSVEAHFAGSREDCLQFTQVHASNIPTRSCKVTPDLCGGRPMQTGTENASSARPSWEMSNSIQKVIEDNAIEELPQGYFHLDPEQQSVVASTPPLLLESRSGTGKTNVLFQHVISRSREIGDQSKTMPLCFVTVSKLLRSQLMKMYSEIKGIDTETLQSCIFLSLSDLLDGLASSLKIGWEFSDATSFNEYIVCRKTRKSLPISQSLIENEIGGVIMGSLRSAQLRRPLNWMEYRDDIRSNISNKNDSGVSTRRQVYDQFELYQQWKSERQCFDVNDIVLHILFQLERQTGFKRQFFSAVYLDEVQDFSYAMIFLICSIGGTSSLSWVFAGDTAQMISPGCSFKFAGLKQTLLAIKQGIEPQLKQVAHLLVNYRTTRDVLEFGNAILSKAKAHYPGAIEFARKEEAVNDFGIPVVLCDWDEAMLTEASFGQNQALVYSISADAEASISSVKRWLGDHPFILSVLESKGLEFDDVVVAFSLQRASWKVESEEASALAMLRELYVAVTRAKRRVVLLVKRGSDTMLKFFEQLECGLEYHPRLAELFEEFNSSTSNDQWMERANKLFQEERYDVASRYFDKAASPAMSAWALGRHFAQKKDKKKAKEYLLQATQAFYCCSKYTTVLDIVTEVLAVSDWAEKPPQFAEERLLLESIKRCPLRLSSMDMLRIKIFRDDWKGICLDEVEANPLLANKRRFFPGLTNFMNALGNEDLQRIAKSLPCIAGDVHVGRKQYNKATELFLLGKDFEFAMESSEAAIHMLKKKGDLEDLVKLADMWRPNTHYYLSRPKSKVYLLLSLLDDPEGASVDRPTQYFQALGPRAIRFAVDRQELNPTILHSFCKNSFHETVLCELQLQHRGDLAQVVFWFLSKSDKYHASEFVSGRVSKWSVSELLTFVEKGVQSPCVAQEFANRRLYCDAVRMFIACNDPVQAIKASNTSLSLRRASEAFQIVRIWRQHTDVLENQNTTAPKVIQHDNLRLALNLYNYPLRASEGSSEKYIEAFGPSIIQDAVLRGAPYFLPQEREIAKGGKYVDVQEILGRFGSGAKMTRQRILDFFHDHNRNADAFIDFHIKSWTKKELFDIVKWGHRSNGLAHEFFARHFDVKAAELCLGEQLFDKAVEASNRALASPALASKNEKSLRNLWLSHEYKSKFKEVQCKLVEGTRLQLLLLLWQEPLKASATHAKECFRCFGADIVREAVLRCAPYDNGYKDELSVLAMFSENAFLNDGLRVVKHYLGQEDRHNASRFVTYHLSQWTNDDLLRILEFDLRVEGLPDELYRRGLYDEAAILYADIGNLDLAAAASDKSLSRAVVSLDKACSALDLWQSALGKTHGKFPPFIESKPNLCLLLSLFSDPIAACARRASDCMRCFEPRVVQEAVLSCYPFTQQNDMDPLDVLQKFDSNNRAFNDLKRIDILRALDASSKHPTTVAVHYAHCDMEHWSRNFRDLSDKDLLLLLDLNARPTDIGTELLKRQMFVKATETFLESGSVREAVTSSNRGLASIKFAAANAEPLVNLWEKAFGSIEDASTHTPETSKLWLLLFLYRDPIGVSKIFGRQCMVAYGANVVKAAVLKKQPYYSNGRQIETSSVLRAFDANAFTSFFEKQRQRKPAGKGGASAKMKHTGKQK